MKYDTPEVTAFVAAVDGICGLNTKYQPPVLESLYPEGVSAYEDYE
jgi:hypothetical protein